MTEAQLTAAITVPAEAPTTASAPRSARDAYYDRRHAYYRTMGEDYSTSAEWAALDTNARYPR
jgi:hypothetical protein